MLTIPTARAAAVTLRTYCRSKDDAGHLETWEEVNQRATYDHHEKLWIKALSGRVVALTKEQHDEMAEIRALGVDRKSTVAGRTLWLGGTAYAETRPCCQFNCAGAPARSIYDMVDVSWLLLNGCGVGFKPQVGTLHGYVRSVGAVEVIPSAKSKDDRGEATNLETMPTAANGWTWTIRVGDSAEAWAKAIGKMFSGGSRRAKKLVIDGGEVRGPGGRLKGYGWICNGFEPFAKCLLGIHETLNNKAGQLLDEIDIMDCVNRVGEVLSSRRSAQATLLDATNPIEPQYAVAKHEYWNGNPQRRQSNNSVLFWSKPSKPRIMELLVSMDACGGDPGIVNAEAARNKCPWFEYFNPCLTKETLVLVADGRKAVRIDQLAHESYGFVRFPVVSAKFEGGRWVGEVKQAVAFRTGFKQVGVLTLSDGTAVTMTPDHRVALFGGGYVEAAESIGRRVEAFQFAGYGGHRVTVHDLEEPLDDGPEVTVISYESKGEEDVYDLTVEDNHNFYIQTATKPGPSGLSTHYGLLVHNCFEIMLGSVCNLVNNCLPRFKKNYAGLQRAIWVMARANYRQTCVDFDDGILQPQWGQTNDALRLCGVSLTGIAQSDWMTDYQIRQLRNVAVAGAYSMADELGLPRPKAVTTVTPGGTISKVMGGEDVGEVMEGIHMSMGRYIFNWVNYSKHDPIVECLQAAGYRTIPNPQDTNNVLICFPVEYRGGKFDTVDGVEVNMEPATAQLDRYLRWNTLWADHNVSCTVSYSPGELPRIAEWLDENWDRGYVATAFMKRIDPTMTAKDCGHPYLPQEVVGPAAYREYKGLLRPADFSGLHGVYDTDEAGCVGGSCPSR